ncbi:MAG: signal peptidase II [Spirochaetota bacterium]
MKYFFIVAAFTTTLAQVGSYLINRHIAIGETVELNSVLFLTHVRNHGGIFGIMQGYGWIFTTIIGFILLYLVYFIYLQKNLRVLEYICFGFILGGGLSNFLDRFIYGSVIDFINVQHIPYWKYIFNTADTFIHIGVWPMVLIKFYDYRLEKQSIQSS